MSAAKNININLKIWRQKNANSKGSMETYKLDNVSTASSFLEMLDQLNEQLINENIEPVAFDHDCREGICGMCSLYINGRAHGPDTGITTCQLHMRMFNDGDTIYIEPWRSKAFPVIKDLVVDRSAFDRIQQAGGFVSVNTSGNTIDANSIPVPKDDADKAFMAAACIGCGACVTACHLENNVPAVGKDEVRRSREMHWMRIDRYYSSVKAEKDYHDLNGRQDYLDAEVSADEPTVAFQPVMCQHCNHAPCETVCPVAATTHSEEGLNQMTYNRCVGTRYCANNCPYKVRRFNWFQYDSLNIPAFPDFAKVNAAQDDLGRMVLNPDVVVRSRGVMEKCSMCVQRIQGGKLEAKKNGEKVQDGAIQTACSSACPTNAISFGDLNDPQHTINKEKEQERAYFLLEEVGAQPNVYYQTKVRNV